MSHITLPTDWHASISAVLELERSFTWPSIDPDRERIFILIRSVPGLRTIILDGEAFYFDQITQITIPVPRPTRNRGILKLEVDRELAIGESEWGRIALVIALSTSEAGELDQLAL